MLHIALHPADSNRPIPAYFGDISPIAAECAGRERRGLLGTDGFCPEVWARNSAVE